MAALQEYKCPCCGGSIRFDSETQKMKCPFCDTEFETQTLKEYDEVLQSARDDDMHWEQSPGKHWESGEEASIRTYVCPSCGGQILSDATTAATTCPFCDSPIVMMEQLSGSLKPDYVIPFQLDKQAAKAALKRHIAGKRLLPKVFKDEAHLDEIKGLYVPFWLFDADASANLRFRATRVRGFSDSNYHYTETSFYSVLRAGSIGFSRVPVDGSERMADDLMESIEPFDFSKAVDFQTAYLAGFLADKYDVDADQSIARANERIKKSTEDAFSSTVIGYSSVIPEASGVKLQNGSAKYALYPVWLLNTTWQGKTYTFAMNGQTGRFVGDLPLDKQAYLTWLLALGGIISAAVFGLLFLMWLL